MSAIMRKMPQKQDFHAKWSLDILKILFFLLIKPHFFFVFMLLRFHFLT